MPSFHGPYPKYARKLRVTNNGSLAREDVSAGHVRLYLPDLGGCLRLILINDSDTAEHFVLGEVVLEKEFGVHYSNLALHNLDGYTRVENLDALNRWPVAFYPDGVPRKKHSPEITPPQAAALCRLAEIMPASKTDAWL